MKQIRFKHLATLGICCSLFSNSLAGVTAVAETMTIESSPTAESTKQTASTKESVETEVKETQATETSEAPTKESQEEQENGAAEVKKEEQEAVVEDKTPQQVIEESVKPELPEPRKIAPKVSYNFPEQTFQFGFVDEEGVLVDPTDINFNYDYSYFQARSKTGYPTLVDANQRAETIGDLKSVVLPAVTVTSPATTGGDDWNGYVLSNVSITLPKYYTSVSIYDATGKINEKYPLPLYKWYDNNTERTTNSLAYLTLVKKSGNIYKFSREANQVNTPSFKYIEMFTKYIQPNGARRTYALGSPAYYHLTQRKVAESFKNPAGAKIPPPPNFEEGRKTKIDSNDFTYTQSGTLPKSYKGADGKTYFLKGWYKGKTKPSTLETGTPTYKVTYDDNDDLTVVYEEAVEKTATIPAITYKFGFVNEKGTLVAPANFMMQTNLTTVMNETPKQVGTATGVNNGSLKHLTIPSQVLTYTPVTKPAFSGATDFRVTIPRYYKTPTVKPGTYYTGSSTAYPMATTRLRYTDSTIADDRLATDGQEYGLFPTTTPHSYQMYRNFWITDTNKTLFNGVLSRAVTDEYVPNYYTTDDTMYYFLENRRVTENFVDPAGNKLPSVPTGFKQGQQTVINTSPFTYTSAKALPDSYKGSDGKTYIFKGWYKGKDKKDTLETTKTPSYPVAFDDNDDLNVVYEEAVAKASVTLARTTAATVANNGNVTWTATLTNTGQAELSNATIKKSSAWTTGLAAPTSIVVTVAGGTAKTVPVTATTWTNGVSLGSVIPVGQSATLRFTTKATGTPNQVLKAAITTSGNYSAVAAENTVRIKDSDQDVTTPVADGFISTPTFDFGQVNISSNTQQHGLKKAADYYNNGARNPYLRIKKTQPNWSLTAQLSQPKSAKDSLPTATRLLLGQAAVSKVDNYNLVTEMLNPVGTTSALSLTANNAVTNVITDKQFTGNDVYNLDFNFNNVKLEVPANQGTKGEQYNATVTWNLVTGP